MKIIKVGMLIGLLTICGCADTLNKSEFNGGLFTSSKADYIVVSQSGGLIMDIWKLRNSFVSSPQASDGWIFTTDEGSLAIGGDAKVIRIKSSKVWDTYHEYHMEFESVSYREKYNNKNK